MKLEVARISYAIQDIGIDDFMVWTNSESLAFSYLPPLDEIMEKELPVHHVDYNGHFGDNLFYTVDVEDDTPELHEKIRTMLVEAIRMAKVNTKARDDAPKCPNCGTVMHWFDCCQIYVCREDAHECDNQV